jgi:hypothetical protein
MRLLITALLVFFISWPAQAYLIPLNGTIEIDGPWALNQLVIGQISLSASATITPASADLTNFNTFVEWVVATDLSVPGANVQNGAPVGALGLLEVIGANFGTNCTSCSQTATIFWNPPALVKHTITTSTNGLNFGSGVSNLQASLDLELPDGFSIASVPEPSTWAMLLIGFGGAGSRYIGADRNCTFHTSSSACSNHAAYDHDAGAASATCAAITSPSTAAARISRRGTSGDCSGRARATAARAARNNQQRIRRKAGWAGKRPARRERDDLVAASRGARAARAGIGGRARSASDSQQPHRSAE